MKNECVKRMTQTTLSSSITSTKYRQTTYATESIYHISRILAIKELHVSTTKISHQEFGLQAGRAQFT